MAAGTVNTLSDGAVYTYADEFSSDISEEPNACLYSKSDLVINGAGTLSVDANNNNGITSKDTLTVDGATVSVDAVNHGINGKDSATYTGANVTVTAKGDGIRSTEADDTTLGWIKITDSDITVTSGEDGIQAERNLYIYSGNIDITSNGGADGIITGDESSKGLKGNDGVYIYGGNTAVDSADDAVHTNGSFRINGGSLSLISGDDVIHADTGIDIAGGTISAAGANGITGVLPGASSQCAAEVSFATDLPAKTELSLKKNDGTALLTYSPSKTFRTAVISSPQIENGGEYTLYCGGSEAASFTVSGAYTKASGLILPAEPMKITFADGFASGIREVTTVEETGLSVFSANGTPLKNSDIVGTGCILIKDGISYTAVVGGDVSGDGKIGTADFLMVRDGFLDKITIDGAKLRAGAVSGGATLRTADFLKIRDHFLGKTNIYA